MKVMMGDSLYQHSRRRTADSGAILPLLLLLMVPILILLALVVDIGIVLNASRDLEQKTRNAALSSLSAFQDEYRNQIIKQNQGQGGCTQCNDPGRNCTPFCAMAAAHLRAQEIARANLSIGERFSGNSSLSLHDFTKKISSYDGSLETDGEFRMGIYYWLKPAECDVFTPPSWCPEQYPFFRTIDLNSDADLALANAIELRAAFPSTNPIMGLFSGILSKRSFSVQSTARAAILPRNDVFLIDLSRSMYRDNYYRDPVPPAEIAGSESEFNFLLRSGVGVCNNASNSVSAVSLCCASACVVSGSAQCLACQADPPCTNLVESGDGYSGDEARFSALDGTPPFPDPALAADLQHFSTQYRCVPVPYAWSNLGVTSRNFLVDYGNTSGNFTMSARPEPLFSVLDAANFALRTLRERNMSVDRTGLIAFESDENNLISTNPRVLQPSSTTSPAFTTFENATNTGWGGYWWAGFLSRSLVPRPGANSDIFQPLREAGYLISLEPSYKIGKNSITIFTDGLQNCVYSNTGVGDWWEKWERTGRCVNNGDQIIAGIQNLVDEEFVDELKRRQIAVNVILFGENVGPHRVIRKSIGGQGCRDQIEDNAAPSGLLPFVDSSWDTYVDMDTNERMDAFRNASSAAPFFAPNKLYDGLVAPTKGLWLPVLPAYPHILASGTPWRLRFWDELQEACSNAPDSAPLANLALDVRDPDDSNQTIHITGVTDAAGRLRYDPLAGTIADQMTRFVDQIIQSPYVLVP